MVKGKSGRKSVSFQQPDEDNSLSVSTTDGPRIRKSISVVPFHYALIIGAMFKGGLMDNVRLTLTRGYFLAMAFQIGYGHIVVRKIIESGNDQNNVQSTAKIHTIVNGLDGKRSRKLGVNKNDNVVLLVFVSLLISMVLSGPLFGALILFGAPLSSHLTETYLLSLHLSIIILFPLLIMFKLDYNKFLTVFSGDALSSVIISNPILCSAFSSLLFTWLGVIPIPLDWDRPWQQWPITLVSASYVGSLFGGLLSFAI